MERLGAALDASVADPGSHVAQAVELRLVRVEAGGALAFDGAALANLGERGAVVRARLAVEVRGEDRE